MIGFSCPPLAVRPFQEAAELVMPHFEHWEIISEADHWLPEIREQVKDLIETTDMGLSVHGPYSDVNLSAFDTGTRKRSVNIFLELIDICAELGIGPVTAHPGVIGPIQYWDKARVPKLTRQSLEDIASRAGDNSVLLALENMPDMRGTICRTAAEMEAMLQDLDIGMCLDIGHAHTNGQIGEMMKLQEKFINIHVHDNHGDRDAHLPLGEGDIDFSVLKNLDGYKGNFIIEAKRPEMEEALASKMTLQKIFE